MPTLVEQIYGAIIEWSEIMKMINDGYKICLNNEYFMAGLSEHKVKFKLSKINKNNEHTLSGCRVILKKNNTIAGIYFHDETLCHESNDYILTLCANSDEMT